MSLLSNIILNLLQLLEKGQRRHAPSSVPHQNNTNRLESELRLIQATLKQIQAEAEADRSLKNEELTIERKRLKIERWTLGIVVIGAMGAFLNLWFVKDSLDATRKSADAATSATRIANDSLVIQNRPWIFFERRNFQLVGNIGTREDLAIQNKGTTVALKVAGCVVFEVLEISKPPNFNSRPCEQIEINVLRPDSEIVQEMRVLRRDTPGHAIPDNQTALAVQTGKMYITTHGRLTFHDVFGIDHWVTFCDHLYYGGPMLEGPIQSLMTCAHHNEMDNYTRSNQPEE